MAARAAEDVSPAKIVFILTSLRTMNWFWLRTERRSGKPGSSWSVCLTVCPHICLL